MGTEAISTDKLRIFFFPYTTFGHFTPMLHMAALFSSSSSSSVSSTIITSSSNAHLVPRSLLLLPLPTGWDSSSPSAAADLLSLLRPDPPHCLVSDMFLPWTVDVADELRIPRIVFHGMSSFSLSLIASIKRHRPQDNHHDDHFNQPFLVPGLPRPIHMTRSQLPGPLRAQTHFNSLMDRMDESEAKSYGVIINSFYELEAGFGEHYRDSVARRAWHVGPVSLPDNNTTKVAGHDDDCSSSSSSSNCLAWLDSKKPDSVIYVCFGTQARFSACQLAELARGLVNSAHYFIWVLRKDSPEVWLERELASNNKEKGLIVRGWAPQARILNQDSVGAFLTHCGWNSVLEGVSAGKPMVTWPVFGDQPFNEKLVVDELGIGVRVGAQIAIRDDGEEEEEEVMVRSSVIARAVERVMGAGEEAAEMRGKARKLGEEARGAVKEGGSSWKDVNRLIVELRSLHKDLII